MSPGSYAEGMAERRSKGDDAIYFEHDGPCRDVTRHRRCGGRWRGEVTLGYSPEGRRKRRRVSGTSKAAVQDKLKELRKDIDAGITKPAPANYTVRKAADDWLADGLPGRSPETVSKNEHVLKPVIAVIGGIRLRELTVQDVDNALREISRTRASSTVGVAHNALTRLIRHAEVRDLVARNVSALAGTPQGQAGRPSRSLSLAQAVALLAAAAGTRIGAYIVLCLTTGIRTEEARALQWDHVDFGAPYAKPPRPASVAVWRSVRRHGDTKTERSRRTLKLPQMAVDVLAELQALTGGLGLVFCTSSGGPLDAANVRREFRAACKAADIGENWTPRELRHSFVSLLSDAGVPVEEIARLAGHSSSRTTEVIYRHQLRPVMTAGAEAMDKVLAGKPAAQPRRARRRESTQAASSPPAS